MAGAAFDQLRRSKRDVRQRADCNLCLYRSQSHGGEVPDLDPKSRREKLLDDTEALLHCEPEFDRQIALSLS